MGAQKVKVKPHLKPSPLANVKLEMAKKSQSGQKKADSKGSKSRKKK